MTGETIGGLLLIAEGGLQFVPATVALRVAPPPRVTPVPGSPPELLGVALYEGTVVPVLAIGSARAQMVVCQHGGELLGLVGGEVVRTGSFVRSGTGDPLSVDHEGQTVPAIEVGALYARVQAHARPGRWG
jgi:hypothetical protein